MVRNQGNLWLGEPFVFEGWLVTNHRLAIHNIIVYDFPETSRGQRQR